MAPTLFINKYILIIFGILLSVFPENFSLKVNQQTKCSHFRKAKNAKYVIAHRGVHNGIPENSLPAYQKAIDLGCDFVEIDVRTTKDSQFVSIHNSAVDTYVEGVSGAVRDMTLSELKELDIDSRIDKKWENTQIPTFEEILQLCKGKIGIYLDLKDAPVPELMKIIRKYEMEQDIIWYISSEYLLGMQDYNQVFGKSFPMPDPHSEDNLTNVLEKLNPCIIATDMGDLSESFVSKSHKYGAKVFVDEDQGTQAEWGKIIRWKTDGIQTDNPEKLIEYLKDKKWE